MPLHFPVVCWWFCFVCLSSYLLRLSINSLCFLYWERTLRIFISHLSHAESVSLLEMTEESPGLLFSHTGKLRPGEVEWLVEDNRAAQVAHLRLEPLFPWVLILCSCCQGNRRLHFWPFLILWQSRKSQMRVFVVVYLSCVFYLYEAIWFFFNFIYWLTCAVYNLLHWIGNIRIW